MLTEQQMMSLEDAWAAETEDSETWEYRAHLTPEEQRYVDYLEDTFARGIVRMYDDTMRRKRGADE